MTHKEAVELGASFFGISSVMIEIYSTDDYGEDWLDLEYDCNDVADHWVVGTNLYSKEEVDAINELLESSVGRAEIRKRAAERILEGSRA